MLVIVFVLSVFILMFSFSFRASIIISRSAISFGYFRSILQVFISLLSVITTFIPAEYYGQSLLISGLVVVQYILVIFGVIGLVYFTGIISSFVSCYIFLSLYLVCSPKICITLFGDLLSIVFRSMIYCSLLFLFFSLFSLLDIKSRLSSIF